MIPVGRAPFGAGSAGDRAYVMRRRRPHKRRLFNLAAAVALLLCIPIVWLWMMGARREAGIRGAYYSGDRWYAQVTAHKHVVSLDIVAGRYWPQIRAAHFPALASGFGTVRRGEWGAKLGDLPPLPGNMAFTGVSLDGGIWLTNTPTVRVRAITIAADSWLILLILLAIASLLLTVANRRRRSDGVCANCGYDLRATPDRCPECGAVPDRAARAAA
jgi:hypothetical protein